MSLNVELLEQSFELVKPQADAFVASFYNNLFTDYPAAKPLFEHSDMAGQQKMLKGALVMVVENLRKPDVLSSSLRGLGARHVKYGALPEHYPLVGNSLLKTLGQYAGDAWTPELKGAWTDAYGAITELMLDGADYKKTDVQLTSAASSATSAGGPVTAAVSPDPSTAAATVPLADLDGTTQLTDAPTGLSNGAAAGVIGGCGAALLVMLLVLL